MEEPIPIDLSRLDPEEVDLLSHMLALNPNKRRTASELCNHPYFGGWRPKLVDNSMAVDEGNGLHSKRSTRQAPLSYRLDETKKRAIVHIGTHSTPAEDKKLVDELKE